jgi:hypothetical protein
MGRKPFNVPVIEVCDTLKLCRTVSATAKKLNVSRAYIYKVLKLAGLTAKECLGDGK